MKVLRYSLYALALVALAACGGKTKTTTKPVTDSATKSDRVNPCDGTMVNPCGPDIKSPETSSVNPCVGATVNPCGPGSGGVDPISGDTRTDPISETSPKY